MDWSPPGNPSIGKAPGTLIYVGDQESEAPIIDIIDYDDENYTERRIQDIKECSSYFGKPTVTWINICGLNEEIIGDIGEQFGFHPLLLEDILNTEQRPKMDEYDRYAFFILKMLTYDEEKEEIETEQVSMILNEDCVISFQEVEGDVFDPLRERLRTNKGIVRKHRADYLAYSLIDAIVDYYFVILEKIGDDIEELEDELLENPQRDTVETLHNKKRQMITLRKSIWPLREVISKLERGGTGFIEDTTRIYLRDVYDHTIQAMDSVETYRDLLTSMLDIYVNNVNNKMTEIMKVLTIVGTIFIPLTFISSVYGMNFKFMPELYWELGYPLVWAIMILASLVMIIYFRKKKWL
ncbi:MAG TPA: magnesium/cobalt transporter CorA [Candidatus Bathyarchaeia archaeon]